MCVLYIYIYAFSRRFYPKRLTVHSGWIFFVSMCVFPGNRTHNLCAANAMLYHWAPASVLFTWCQSFKCHRHLCSGVHQEHEQHDVFIEIREATEVLTQTESPVQQHSPHPLKETSNGPITAVSQKHQTKLIVAPLFTMYLNLRCFWETQARFKVCL